MLANDKYKEAWNKRVGEYSAHIKNHDTYLPKDGLYKFYGVCIGSLNLDNKNVLDYGHGGALFYEWLVNNYKIKSYVGIDIAERQNKAANEKAQKLNFKDYQFKLVEPNEIGNLNQDGNIDIFTCLAVIQHFPDKEYYEYFFKNLNEMKIKTLILSIKYSQKTEFRDVPYKTTNDIAWACLTNKDDILSLLTNYYIDSRFESNNTIFQLKLKRQNSIR